MKSSTIKPTFSHYSSKNHTMTALPDIFYSISRNAVTAIGLPLALGFSSGYITRNAMPWYAGLLQPAVSSLAPCPSLSCA